jgi:hypothetical protein
LQAVVVAGRMQVVVVVLVATSQILLPLLQLLTL